MTREEKILRHIAPGMKILELGASYNPLVAKVPGWEAYSLDHLDQEGLRAKYLNDPAVDIGRIQPVDFVWKDGPLDSAVTDEHRGTFDAIVASHMIEHFPDLIGFFQACARILKEGGVLSLAIPDKRYCFDYFHPIHLTGDVLQAHLEGRTRHSRAAIFNTTAYNSTAGGIIAWGQHETQELRFENGNVHEAYGKLKEYRLGPDDPYTDAHGWYFTPSSFRLICLELGALGLIPFAELDFHDATGCEFHVTLVKRNGALPDAPPERRMELLKKMLLEVREQTDYLLGANEYLV